MKNIIKKLTTIALAFTMIGSGTTITKSVSPNSDNSLTAEAYGDNNIYVSNLRLPSGNLPKGNSFPIRGIIHSKYKITKVYGGVCYRYDYDPHNNNQKTDQYIEIDNPALSSNSSSYSYTYDLSGEFNKNIVFNYLSAGEYICYVCAQYYDHINKKTCYVSLCSQVFTVYSLPSSRDAFADFSDVTLGHWYSRAIEFVYDRNIMNGKGVNPSYPSDKIFDPENTITRAEFVQVLYNHMGKPRVNVDQNNLPFSDMKKGQWYINAVCWAKQHGIAAGYPNGSFGISNPITREELIQMLYKYADLRGYRHNWNNTVQSSKFDDILSSAKDKDDISSWAKEAITWAIEKDVIDYQNSDINQYNYYRTLKIAPKEKATRAECAQMIQNLLENARY